MTLFGIVYIVIFFSLSFLVLLLYLSSILFCKNDHCKFYNAHAVLFGRDVKQLVVKKKNNKNNNKTNQKKKKQKKIVQIVRDWQEPSR